MHTALLALGSNLGNPLDNLRQAIQLLEQEPAICLLQVSEFYETEPYGMRADEPAKPFMNAAVKLETGLTPKELLSVCLKVEQALGRKRAVAAECSLGYSSRTLDMDILFYDDWIIQDTGLEIPHPRLQERSFVLLPLLDVAPDWKHPLLGRTVAELADSLAAACH